MGRFLYLIFGWAAVCLGILGVFVPGLPTTPFLLVAAFAFSRSSPRLKLWLETHPQFGPPIRDWEERGAISRRAKMLSLSMMTLILAVSLILALPWQVLAVQVALMAAGAWFILTRPD
jgi:uncharacterized membrane protein YbaN (DUF454 family)